MAMATTTTPNKPHSSVKHHLTNPSSSQVRVVLRVRPFLLSELEADGKKPTPCISADGTECHSNEEEEEEEEEVTVHIKDQWSSRNEFYKLDSFFGQDDHVGQIFHKEVSRVIPRIFRGSNATIFAYGATGSGKTYTMQGTEDEPGLIPLAMSTILSSCRNTETAVEIAYYEVYLDRCYDLLEPQAKEIMTLNDKDGNLQLKGLSWVLVHSMEEFTEIFSTGVQRRKVAHTGLNDVSSRSHGVLAISVTEGSTKGKLNLIDLAGNEDNRRSCNEGIRLQESAKINQSLFALSNVIYALNCNEPRIPYRESKLTRILQDSLGGPSRALMIACLNPISYQEAIHTVSLAARSRHIVNYAGSSSKRETPREKVDMEAKLRAWLESKGKTRNTPNFAKKLESARSSMKSKPTNRLDVKTKGRKLFDLGTTATATTEENKTSEIEVSQYENMLRDLPFTSNSESVQVDAHALGDKSLIELAENTCSSNTWDYGVEDDTYMNICPSVTENVNCQKCLTTPKNSDRDLWLDVEGQKGVNHDVKVLKKSDLPGKLSDKENSLGSQLNYEKTQEPQNSIRKVLSPISSNVSANKSCKEPICLEPFEPKTPKTPYMNHEEDDIQMTATPLDKFNALSSNLKESLAQEYLAFLNVASKEELLQLKGIGQKRAEYILELRELTPKPLKSLSDLENIGLSSKQVHDMFRRMARGIF